jgi:hypothetical protein
MTAFSIWGNMGNEAFAMPMVKLTPTLPASQGYGLFWDTVNQGLNFFPFGVDPVTGYFDIVADSAVALTMPRCPLQVTGTQNNYVQFDIRNTSNGVAASADICATADTGTDTTQFVNLGINNSAYAQAGWTINGALDSYLYASDGVLSIGTAAAKELNFFTGGTLLANKRMALDTSGNILVGGMAAPASAAKTLVLPNSTIPTANAVNGGCLYVEAGALKYRGSGGTVTVLGAA